MVMNIGSAVKGLVVGIIGVVIIFLLVSNLANDLQNAGNNMSNSGLPLANLFGANGVIILTIVAGILIGVVAIAMKMGKFGGK